MRRASLLASLLVCLVSGSACATVPPWQRETLASDRMNLDLDPDEQAMVVSRRRTREEGVVGAAGAGPSASGGGCGCN